MKPDMHATGKALVSTLQLYAYVHIDSMKSNIDYCILNLLKPTIICHTCGYINQLR